MQLLAFIAIWAMTINYILPQQAICAASVNTSNRLASIIPNLAWEIPMLIAGLILSEYVKNMVSALAYHHTEMPMVEDVVGNWQTGANLTIQY